MIGHTGSWWLCCAMVAMINNVCQNGSGGVMMHDGGYERLGWSWWSRLVMVVMISQGSHDWSWWS